MNQSKDYYDKYLRNHNEGICQFCGKETMFASIVKGYPKNICKHCKNNLKSTQEKRKQTYSKKNIQKKKDNGYFELPEFCEICKLNEEDKRGRLYQITDTGKKVLKLM